ncbi:MAG: hypothetical protein ACJ768_19670 [Gaiellaceae bacterium]
MADDVELEDLEEIDEPQDPTTEALEDLEETDVDDVDDAPTGNKWANRRSLSEMLEEADEAAPSKADKKPVTPTAPKGKELEGDGEDLDDDDDDEELDEEEEAPKRDTTATQEKPKADGAAKARYAVKGADGKAFEFELEEGTSIQFKADGRDVEVKSIDDLVQLAQKGAAFDRKTSEQGQIISRLESTTGTLTEQLATLRTTAEETLMAALFDREKRQELRRALAPYRDPEFRKGVEAQQELEANKQEKQATEEQQLEEKRTEFWQGVGTEIKKEITNAEHLTDDDAIEIARRFHAGYVQSYQTKLAELVAGGLSEEKAAPKANEFAASHFTEKNLRRVVRGLNAELADERTGAKKKGAKPVAASRDPKAGQAEAEAHNRTTKKKLEQRRVAPKLAGGGALPGGRAPGATARPAKPLTFAQRMERAGRTLRNGAPE